MADWPVNGAHRPLDIQAIALQAIFRSLVVRLNGDNLDSEVKVGSRES